MTETEELREALCTSYMVIMELGRDLGVKECWQDILSDLASHFVSKAQYLAIQNGQIAGKLQQEKWNLEQECEVLKQRLAIAESALAVPMIPYREQKES